MLEFGGFFCLFFTKKAANVIAFIIILNAFFFIKDCNSRRILDSSRSMLAGLNSSLSLSID